MTANEKKKLLAFINLKLANYNKAIKNKESYSFIAGELKEALTTLKTNIEMDKYFET